MFLLDFHEDILLHVEQFMDVDTFKNWRFVLKTKWNIKLVTKHCIKTFENRTCLSPRKCVVFNCNHPCLTQLNWIDNNVKDFVPWCAVHIDPIILKEIDMYCIGCLEIHGASLF